MIKPSGNDYSLKEVLHNSHLFFELYAKFYGCTVMKDISALVIILTHFSKNLHLAKCILRHHLLVNVVPKSHADMRRGYLWYIIVL